MVGSGYRTALTLVALIAVLTACGSSSKNTGASSATTAPAATTTTTAVPRSGAIAVTAKDYEFVGVPPLVASGATFTLHNASSSHVHEMVAVKLPATEHRSLATLTKLSHADLVAALGVRPTFVIFQPPGAPAIKGFGDGTVTEPGRYLMICSVQLNVTPSQYLEALTHATGEAPEIPGGGAPHYTQGMYAGFTVK